MPTIAEIANVKAPENIDGLSVLPTLLGNKQDLGQRYLYWEFYERNGWRAIRFGDWKAVQQDMYKDEPRAIELYNLREDIGETNDVAGKHPEIVKKVKDIFNEAHSPSPHFMWKQELKSTNTL
jgi:arylsulfatase A-like enzyme